MRSTCTGPCIPAVVAAAWGRGCWRGQSGRHCRCTRRATRATRRREFFIATVGVTRAARGRGIASALLGRSLGAARADGCDIATLYVGTDSPTGALTLYEHMGFTKQRTSVTLIKDLTDQ